jgi:hypothetical protein
VPGHAIEDVLLRDVDLPMTATTEPAVRQQDIPEAPAEYPDPHMFSMVMPAYGLWTRHVRRLTLRRVRFAIDGPDRRPMLLAGPDADSPCTP